HKLIRAYTVTPASTHDSQELQALLEAPSTRKALWADGAYQSEAHAKLLQARGIENHCMSVPGGSRP
ncbi:MAG: transposase, partial [Gammaproteobacteria bacterium]